MLNRKNSRRKNKENPLKPEKSSNKMNVNSQQNNLIEQIKNSVVGLYYMSETDAEIFPFIGKEAESVTKEEILSQSGNAVDSSVEEKGFTEFFARLTDVQDWFGDEEKRTVEKYLILKELLEKNLRDLKVFRIGKTQLDIYVVGLDAEDKLLGIKTKAVET